MKRKIVLFVFVCLNMLVFSQANNRFYKSVHDTVGRVKSIVLLDSCGTALLFEDDLGNGCVAKYDCNDLLIWERCFSFLNFGTYKLTQVDDGGVVVLASRVNSTGNSSMVLIKYDGNGNHQWTKNYQPNISNSMWGICRAKSNTLLVSGGGCSGQNSVIKINAINGSIVWQFDYVGTPVGLAQDMIQTQDGNYLILSNSGSMSNMNTGLLKIDDFGNVLWQKMYDFALWELCADIKELADGSIIISSQSNALDSVRNEISILKIAPSGTLGGAYILHHPVYEGYTPVSAGFYDGSIIVAGHVFVGGATGLEAIIIKLNSNLDSVEYVFNNSNFQYNHLGVDENLDATSKNGNYALLGCATDGATLINWPQNGVGLCVTDTMNISVIPVPFTEQSLFPTRTPISFPAYAFLENTFSVNYPEVVYCSFVSVPENTKLNTNNFLLYPNPSSDFLTLDLGPDFAGKKTTINIYNTIGECVLTFNSVIQDGVIKQNLAQLSSGLFFITLSFSDGPSLSGKFVVSK